MAGKDKSVPKRLGRDDVIDLFGIFQALKRRYKFIALVEHYRTGYVFEYDRGYPKAREVAAMKGSDGGGDFDRQQQRAMVGSAVFRPPPAPGDQSSGLCPGFSVAVRTGEEVTYMDRGFFMQLGGAGERKAVG